MEAQQAPAQRNRRQRLGFKSGKAFGEGFHAAATGFLFLLALAHRSRRLAAVFRPAGLCYLRQFWQ